MSNRNIRAYFLRTGNFRVAQTGNYQMAVTIGALEEVFFKIKRYLSITKI